MKKFLTVISLVTLSGIMLQTHGQWKKHTVDDNLPHATIIYVADIDEDGDLDMAANGSPYVRWYQNNSPDTTWNKYNIDNSLFGAVGIAIVDIDGDDTLDVVASGYDSNDIRWYKNEGGTPINWHQYIIDDDFLGVEFLIVGDIDADGDSDLVVTASYGNKVAWYENNLPNPDWTKHIIDDYLGGAMTCDVGDIDGDGDLDVAATGNSVSKVCWYENNLPDTNWNPTVIDGNLSGAFGVCIADIVGDNTLEVLATGQTADKLVWYKNENTGQTWTPYTIDANLNGARIVNVGDIDGDDTLDVVATAYDAGEVVWYKNQHPDWARYEIDTDLGTANWVCTADINADSLLDVVATGRESNKLNWYEQEPVWVKTAEIFPRYLIPEGDTLFVKAHINNQKNHLISVDAKIHGEIVPFTDSLVLYDDGLHFDENPNDNIWGNAKWLSGLEKDIYKVDIYMHDFSLGTISKSYLLNYFTTIGPVVFYNYEIVQNDTNFFKLKYALKNNSLTNTVTDVKAVVLTTDANVTNISGGYSLFGDIKPGEVKSQATFPIYIYTQNNPSHIDFTVNIYSNERFFWSDNFTVDVPPIGIKEDESNLPMEFALEQNYPNPFNPTTTIGFGLPEKANVRLSILNLLGEEIKVLLNEEKEAGYHSVNFNSGELPTGVYFYQLKAGNPESSSGQVLIDTKKMLLLK